MEYKEIPASSIPPGEDDSVVTYQQVQDILTKYIGNLPTDILETQMINHGKAKQPPTKLSVTQLIQCINMLMLDFIKTNNQNTDMKQNNIINSYFDGVNKLTTVLSNTDIKVAETKLLCYIVGYLLKLINHFKHSEEQNNTIR